jgi:hypothetical protein
MARLLIDIESQMVTETGYNTVGITAKKVLGVSGLDLSPHLRNLNASQMKINRKYSFNLMGVSEIFLKNAKFS